MPFFTFCKFVNGRLGTTFCSQTCINFISGKEKWLTKIGAFLLFFFWNIIASARYEAGNHFLGNWLSLWLNIKWNWNKSCLHSLTARLAWLIHDHKICNLKSNLPPVCFFQHLSKRDNTGRALLACYCSNSAKFFFTFSHP